MSRNFIPDDSLIDRLLLSDTSAFEELYHRYCYSLYSYCAGKLNSPEDAKYIVRNIFISLWYKRKTLPLNFSISLYLYTEVRKAVIYSINETLETKCDTGIIEKEIIPGFALNNLKKARQPVKKHYTDPMPGFQTYELKKKYREPWWNQAPSGITLHDLKQTLQKAFNLL